MLAKEEELERLKTMGRSRELAAYHKKQAPTDPAAAPPCPMPASRTYLSSIGIDNFYRYISIDR